MSSPANQPALLSWWRQELSLLGGYLAPRRLLALGGLLVLLGAGLILAYQFPPAQYYVDVGAPDDGPYIDNFHSANFDGDASYRITDYYSYVTIPGTGSLPYTLSLRLDGTNPTASQPLTTTLFVGGVPLYNGRLQGGWQELSLAVNQQAAPAALAARDVVLEIRSQTYNQSDAPNDDRGPKLDWVRVTPTSGGFIAPTVGVLLRLIGFAALLYLLLSRLISLFNFGGRTQQLAANESAVGSIGTLRYRLYPLQALLYTALAAIILVIMMVVAHQALALDSTHLLITVAATYGVLILARLAVSTIPANEPTLATAQSGKFSTQNWLIAAVVIAFAIKFGGMALPQTIVKDMPWHIRFIHEVKANGVEPLLQPNVLSVTPREWDLGSNALIPKSPLFYVAMVPLAYLPGDLEVWVKLVICIIDVSGAIFLYYLARRLLPDGDKVGILAAVVYLLTPLSYRVLSFGTLPTVFAQWLTLLAFAYLALNLARLHRPVQFAVQVVLFALVLLSFPTMVLFTPLVLAVVFVGGFFISDKLVRRNTLIFMPLSALAGAGLAVLVYYGRYIPGIIRDTLPSLAQGTAVRGELPGDKLGGWLGMLGSNINFYGSVIPLVLATFGLVLLFRWGWHRGAAVPESQNIAANASTDAATIYNPPATNYNLQSTSLSSAPPIQTAFLILLGWLLIIPVFYVVNYRLDMIGKHLLYTMYPLALASGVALAWLWRRGQAGRWAVWLLLLAIGLAAASLWVERILYGGR